MSGGRWTQSFALNPAGILVPISLQQSTAATRVGTPAEYRSAIPAQAAGEAISTALGMHKYGGSFTTSQHVTVTQRQPPPTGERPARTEQDS